MVVRLLGLPGLSCVIAAILAAPSTSTYTVQLRKQYVPVEVNGRIVVHKTAYFGTVYVGLPRPQEFTVVFDTGSAHFFLPSIACQDEPCLLHRRYNRSASESAVDIDQDGSVVSTDAQERDLASIAYGTGEVIGEFANEMVCIGAPPTENVTGASHCATARVVLAREMSAEPFRKFHFDGVLGLGMEALSLNPEFNFFGQMSRGAGLAPVFGVFLASNDNVHSEISFGGHNKDRMAGPLQWVPVASPQHGYWQVRVKGLRVGDQIVELCSTGDCTAIVDSGTSLLGVPKQSLQKFHWLLARRVNDGEQDIDCRHSPGPSILFELDNSVSVRLDAEDYSRPAAMRVASKSSNVPHTVCRASLMPVDLPALGPKVFIWGEPLLRKYYTAYNAGDKLVGLAPSKQPDESPAGSPGSTMVV
mmetsp:Transcript_111801/g.193827  ORF Transcript_111801/g.193827 Transcript_111801/m.193827 type:complete len:417 (+) Transcript_111801:81-1331(+)